MDYPRWYADQQSSARRTSRRYLPGTSFSRIPPDVFLIEAGCNATLKINCRDEDDNPHVATVRTYSEAGNQPLLTAVKRLAANLPQRANARVGVGDHGWMFGLGMRDPAKLLEYVITAVLAVFLLPTMNLIVEVMERRCPTLLESMRDLEYGRGFGGCSSLGGKKAASSSLMISKDLRNASHVDFRDQSDSFGVWVEERPGMAKEWSFLLPNVSIGGSRGVAIQLYDGCVIEWDGLRLQHCTTLGKLGDGNHVYGCMVGVCRHRKRKKPNGKRSKNKRRRKRAKQRRR